MTDRLPHSQPVAATRAGFSNRTACGIEADPRLLSLCEPARGRTDFTEMASRVTRTGIFIVQSVFCYSPSRLIGQQSNRRFASGETGPCS